MSKLLKNNGKGFTLMEMLIVVAIIAVLVAIAIPVFTTQLEKAREGVDMSNIRTAYAEMLASYMTGVSMEDQTVPLTQQTAGWNHFSFNELFEGRCEVNGEPSPGGVCKVTFDTTTEQGVFSFE